VAGTIRSSLATSAAGPTNPRLHSTGRLLGGLVGLLGLLGIVALTTGSARPLGWLVLALAALTGVAATLHQRSVTALEAERRAEAERLARILQGLSRAATGDAIVAALIADLGLATGADHTVIVRHRPETDELDATLGGARPGDPSTTIRLAAAGLGLAFGGHSDGVPGSDADALAADPDGAARAATAVEHLERRIATDLALMNPLSAGLRSEHGLIGAIVLARRTASPWPAPARRILQVTAVEAGAAFERVASHRRAEVRASTDALTGLPNRRYFDEFCGLLGGRRRADDRVGILMVDIDHFKRINDRHGHDAGDDVLRQVAAAIASAVREGDVPARFGGEEFAILLRNPSVRVAIDVAERIRTSVGALDLRAIGPASVSVSVGVAVQAEPDESLAELLGAADRALYRAKRAGRDRVASA